jgi:hypothetical protein
VLAVSLLMATAAVGLLACFMVRLFITLDAPGPKRCLLDGIVTGLDAHYRGLDRRASGRPLRCARHRGMTGAIGAGIISFFKRRRSECDRRA